MFVEKNVQLINLLNLKKKNSVQYKIPIMIMSAAIKNCNLNKFAWIKIFINLLNNSESTVNNRYHTFFKVLYDQIKCLNTV